MAIMRSTDEKRLARTDMQVVGGPSSSNSPN